MRTDYEVKYCQKCKSEGKIVLADVLSEFGPLCSKHDLEMKKNELENLAIKRNKIPKNQNNITQFCKAN